MNEEQPYYKICFMIDEGLRYLNYTDDTIKFVERSYDATIFDDFDIAEEYADEFSNIYGVEFYVYCIH